MAANVRLDGIQALRGLAALSVVIHHALEQSNGSNRPFSPDWLTTVGAAGVDLFFIISGFVMVWTALPAGQATMRPATFLYRRVTRIYPIYWLTCAAVLGLMALGFLHTRHLAPAEIGRSLALLPWSPLIPVAWTLVFEMWFYVLFAALLVSRSRQIVMMGVPLLLLSGAGIATLLPQGSVHDFLQSPMPLEFCFGIALAVSARWLIAHRPGRIVVGGMVVAAVVALCLHGMAEDLPAEARVLRWGLPCLVLVALSLSWQITGKAGRWLVRLGDASYALYLSHSFVLIGYGHILKVDWVSNLSQPPLVAMVSAVAVVVGMASHVLCERPMILFFQRLEKRFIAPSVSANPAVAPS